MCPCTAPAAAAAAAAVVPVPAVTLPFTSHSPSQSSDLEPAPHAPAPAQPRTHTASCAHAPRSLSFGLQLAQLPHKSRTSRPLPTRTAADLTNQIHFKLYRGTVRKFALAKSSIVSEYCKPAGAYRQLRTRIVVTEFVTAQEEAMQEPKQIVPGCDLLLHCRLAPKTVSEFPSLQVKWVNGWEWG